MRNRTELILNSKKIEENGYSYLNATKNLLICTPLLFLLYMTCKRIIYETFLGNVSFSATPKHNKPANPLNCEEQFCIEI